MVTLNEFLSAHVTGESNEMNVLGRLETITKIIPISISYRVANPLVETTRVSDLVV